MALVVVGVVVMVVLPEGGSTGGGPINIVFAGPGFHGGNVNWNRQESLTWIKMIKEFPLVKSFRSKKQYNSGCSRETINPIALRKAKIVYNFGFSECKRVKL